MSQQEREFGSFRVLARRAEILEPHEESRLIDAAQRGDAAAVDRIVASHLRLVLQVAGRYSREGLSSQELVNEGVLGLLIAIRRFDPAHRVRFSSYAAHWVRAYVRRFALANRRIVGSPATRGARVAQGAARRVERELTQSLGRAPERREVAEALRISLDDLELAEMALHGRDAPIGPDALHGVPDVPDVSEGPEILLEAAQQDARRRAAVSGALGLLSPRERALALAHLSEEGVCFARMGDELGISRQRVSQIWAGAREKLRSHLSQVA